MCMHQPYLHEEHKVEKIVWLVWIQDFLYSMEPLQM